MKTKVGIANEPGRTKPWRVYWWTLPDDAGKQKKNAKRFKYRHEARLFQTQKQKEIDEGRLQDRPKAIALSWLLEEFEKTMLANLSGSSKAGYADTIKQLREHFGADRKIATIEQRHAERFMSTRKRRDGRAGELASWTRFHHLKHAKAIFGAAVEWGYLSRNPFTPSQTKGRGGRKSPLRIKPKSRPWHHLKPNEFGRLIAATESVRRRAMYWLMYGCGLRPGEVYHLRIDQIDLKYRRVHIRNRVATVEMPGFTVKAEDQTDESKERTISIPDAAIPDLTEAIKLAIKSGGYIALPPERFQLIQRNWALCQQGKPWGHQEVHRAWQNRDMVNNALRDAKSDLRRTGIELSAPFTLPTFRKSFAQNHADNGTHPRTLAKLLGHSNTRITMTYYSQVTDANQQAAAATMDKLLAAELPQSYPHAGSEGVA